MKPVGASSGARPGPAPPAAEAPSGDTAFETVSGGRLDLSGEDSEAKRLSINEMMSQLTYVVRALGNRLQVQLVEGEQLTFDPVKDQIVVPVYEMLAHSFEYRMGALLIATGCLKYSRPLPAECATPAFQLLHKAVEVLRVSQMMCARYGEAGKFLEAFCREKFFNNDSTEMVWALNPPLRVQQFASALANGWARGMWGTESDTDLPIRDPHVLEALERARPFLDEAIRLPPGVDLFFRELGPHEGDLEAQRSLNVLREKVWPIFLELLEKDLQDLPETAEGEGEDLFAGAQGPKESLGDATGDLGPLLNDPLVNDVENSSDALNQLKERINEAASSYPQNARETGKEDPLDTSESSTEPLADSEKNEPTGWQAVPQTPADTPAAPEIGPTRANASKPSLRSGAPRKRTPTPYWSDIRTKLEWEISKFASALQEVRDGQGRKRAVKGKSSGNKVNISQFLQSKFKERATGFRDPNFFERRGKPAGGDVDFVLEVDCSGSMDDPEATISLRPFVQEAIVFFCEALQQESLPHAVVVFGKEVKVLKQFDQFLDGPAQAELLDLVGRLGNTNDIGGLNKAIELLRARPDIKRVVIFLTDGKGSPQQAQEVCRLETEEPGTLVIGVGIGPGCESVAETYPNHLLVRDVQQLTPELSALLVTLLSR